MTDQEGLFSMDTKTAVNPMLDAAKSHIEALQAQNLIKAEHGLTCQIILSLSEAIGKAAAKGQASAMSFASKELREYMALLPKPETIGTFEQLMNALTKDDDDAQRSDPLLA